jgi:hypothetical protein
LLTAELAPFGIKITASGTSTLDEMKTLMDRLDELSLRAKKNYRLYVDARGHAVMPQDVFELLVGRPVNVSAVAAAYLCRDATSTMQISRYLRALGVPASRMLVLNASADPAAETKVDAFLNGPLGDVTGGA